MPLTTINRRSFLGLIPPVNWGINTDRKKAFFALLKEAPGA